MDDEERAEYPDGISQALDTGGLLRQLGGVWLAPHTCTREHGRLVEEPDLDAKGRPIMLAGVAQVTRRWDPLPTCHDCGADLVRPSGTNDTGWVCPYVASYTLQPDPPNGALECGADESTRTFLRG